VVVQRQFPRDIYRQLLAVDFRLLDELTYLSRKQAKRSPSGARYCIPGRQYLAAKLGVCVRTVSRSIARLKRLGILDVTQRRPVRGIWKTNLYKIRHWLGWRLGQVQGLLRKPFHRGTPVAHIATRERVMGTPEAHTLPRNNAGDAILARWKNKGWVNEEENHTA
jgi:hypothetical protein